MRNTSKINDLTGQKFNLLTVKGMAQRNPIYWECVCDCGNTTLVRTSNLTGGKVKSCGCLQHKGNPTHNQSRTRVYRIYAKMLRRCFVESDPAYSRYGGRGITMCDEWKNSFVAFSDWAYSNGYADNLTIDRIDNNGDYCPENCRWTDYLTQCNNKRNNRVFEHNGETKTLSEWCKALNLSYKRIYFRITNGWTFEEAISQKKYVNNHYKEN